MKPPQLSSSVALFYDSRRHNAIPFDWYERALELFKEHELSPIMFTAAGGPFEYDDCYLLADGDGQLYRWGDPQPIKWCRSELVKALKDRVIYGLEFDAPRADGKNRSDWQAKLSWLGGNVYAGIDEEWGPDLVGWIRRAWKIAKGFVDIRYGFAYKMPLEEEPDCYATGSSRSTRAGLRDLLRDRRERIVPRPTPDDLWQKELSEERRHLSGYFRGVYPANLLSAAHVQAADLETARIGSLSPLDDSLWIWQLSVEEMPRAEEMLRDKNLLVAQLDPA
jgi:hypothetical protein